MAAPNSIASQSFFTTLSNSPRFSYKLLTLGIAASLLLTACGDDDDNDSDPLPPAKVGVQALNTGDLLSTPTTVNNLSANQLMTALETIDPAAATVAGTPKCGVRVEYMHYTTVDAKGGKTDATGAVFIPTGSDSQCTGARPVLLHAHGTATQQSYNFAEVGNADNEAGKRATLIAASFTGQGYVVIAPNYAGYDKSSLDYHPYLNANQQAHEMADALKAGRNVLSQVKHATQISDNGKLFLTGYSQGGHVALAAARYLTGLGESVTAAAPQSGPYAMGAFGDVVFGGNVMLGATFFAPLMTHSYQQQFGNLYQTPSDIYAPTNAAQIATLLPSRELDETQLVARGVLPALAMFQASPTGNAALDAIAPADSKFSYGFDNQRYLVKNDYRAAYLNDAQNNPDWGVAYLRGMTQYAPVTAANPTHTLRQALKANDLRSYTPTMPTLLCGGNQDPMVFFDVNTGLINQLWSRQNNTNLKYAMLDMDISNQATRGKAIYHSQGLSTVQDTTLQATATAMQQAFAQRLQLINTNATTIAKASGATDAQTQQAAQVALLSSYHTLVEPYCETTARAFFDTF